MAKTVERGRTAQILQFIREFSTSHGFGPTIREVGEAVGLRSTSTTADYLTRMAKAGLVTSIPGTPRSLQVVDNNLMQDECADGESLLCCKFRFPEGTYPMSVIAMVAGEGPNNVVPVSADKIEILRSNVRRSE